jgi:glycosyltransferase involved in cell wall biosynthesis
VAVGSGSTARVQRPLQGPGFGERIAVLRNGVDAELLSPEQRDEALHDSLENGRTMLLFVGRISREKDLDWLASGYPERRTRRNDVHLVIVGDGPYRVDLEQILNGAATFTGFLQDPESARTIASCDLFLFPSTTDTLGRAVMEAQACGLPAVVRDAGGASECLLPGVSGIVVPVGNDDGYWSSVETLIDDERLRRRLSQAAREFAVQRTWFDVLDGFLALCRTVAGREDFYREGSANADRGRRLRQPQGMKSPPSTVKT